LFVREGGFRIAKASFRMLRIIQALTEETLSQAQALFREYGRMPGVAPCVQDFEREVAALPGSYAPPGGRLLLAIADSSGNLEGAAGCVALRPWEKDTCEMKRLYVRPAFRGQGAAHELVKELITQARLEGYKRIVLDTLPTMLEAHKLYEGLGFLRISAYQKNPLPGALFFGLLLH
jgi:ribosomal protein S18 acetylase RimI-like enzyme